MKKMSVIYGSVIHGIPQHVIAQNLQKSLHLCLPLRIVRDDNRSINESVNKKVMVMLTRTAKHQLKYQTNMDTSDKVMVDGSVFIRKKITDYHVDDGSEEELEYPEDIEISWPYSNPDLLAHGFAPVITNTESSSNTTIDPPLTTPSTSSVATPAVTNTLSLSSPSTSSTVSPTTNVVKKVKRATVEMYAAAVVDLWANICIRKNLNPPPPSPRGKHVETLLDWIKKEENKIRRMN